MLARLFAASIIATAAVTPVTIAPTTWVIDKAHSNVSFTIRHLVSRVHGNFGTFKGSIVADPTAWQSAQIDVEIETASISTNNENRDKDLRSPNFFAADSFPTITFKSRRVERSGDDAKIYGDLTMRGVTKQVVLEGHFNGVQPNTRGDRAGFDATATINRLDYGVKWNRAVEGGGLTLGDEVKIEINVEAIQQKG